MNNHDWRDHPDYRDEETPDFDSVEYRFGAMPCAIFKHHRQQQARCDYEFHRMLIRIGDRDMPVRKRARRAYRELRRIDIGIAYHGIQTDLYAPAPPRPPVSWADMQKSGYWYEFEEKLARLERIFIAAAKTYEHTARPDLADQYWHAAESVHVERMDNLSEATTLQWYEERGHDV